MATAEILKTVESNRDSHKAYQIRRGRDGVVYCTCPGWRFRRTCRHLREFAGGDAPSPRPPREPRKPREIKMPEITMRCDPRTFTDKDGNRSLTSDLTDQYVAEQLRKGTNRFGRQLAAKLAMYGKWYPSQQFWAHKLVLEQINGPTGPAAPGPGTFSNLIEMFDKAAEKVRFPEVKFEFDDVVVRVRRTSEGGRTKHPKCLNVTDDGRYPHNVWFGRIERDGSMVAGGNLNDFVLKFLGLFNADPAAVAAEYGKAKGHCCFCRKALTDQRSLEVGYGPVCAEHWRLPWGQKS